VRAQPSRQKRPNLGDERRFVSVLFKPNARQSVMVQMITDVSKTSSHRNILLFTQASPTLPLPETNPPYRPPLWIWAGLGAMPDVGCARRRT